MNIERILKIYTIKNAIYYVAETYKHSSANILRNGRNAILLDKDIENIVPSSQSLKNALDILTNAFLILAANILQEML